MQQFHTKGRENSGNYACFPPFHEPFPLIPSFSPSGGEGARRAVEGDSDRFMASIHVRILEVSPSHEPQKVAQASCLFGADRLEACPTLQRWRPGSWPQLTSNFWRCSLSMNRVGRDSVEP